MHLETEQFFRALSDLTRLRCLMLLHGEGELCVCELIHAVDLIQPKVSRHLAALRAAGLVADRRQGQWIYYRLHPELPAWAIAVLTATAQGLRDEEPFASDRCTLAAMPSRPGARCCA